MSKEEEELVILCPNCETQCFNDIGTAYINGSNQLVCAKCERILIS